jgi:ABC-2 type transport system permease protein
VRSLLAALRRELRRLSHDRTWIGIAIIAPWGAIAILAAVFWREVPQDLPVAVVDLDGSSLSRRLVRMLDASPTLAVVRATELAEAERLALRNEAYAVITIPRDLQRSLVRGHAATVVCAINTQMLLPASLVRRAVRTVVGTLSAGVELRMRNARGATPAEARERFEPVRLDLHTLFNPRLSYVLFLLTTLAAGVFQVAAVMGAIWTTGRELRDGTAGELVATAGGWRRALLAKALPNVVLFASSSIAALAGIVIVFGLPLTIGLALCAACLLFTTASVAAGMAIASLSANLRFGLSAGAFYAGPALAYAGITFPLSGMTPLAGGWSRTIPLTHLVVVLAGALRTSIPAMPFAWLSGITLAGIALMAVRARRVLLDPSCWGRR